MDFVNKREVKQEIRKFKPKTFEERAGKMILLISPRIYKFIHDLLYE